MAEIFKAGYWNYMLFLYNIYAASILVVKKNNGFLGISVVVSFYQ